MEDRCRRNNVTTGGAARGAEGPTQLVSSELIFPSRLHHSFLEGTIGE